MDKTKWWMLDTQGALAVAIILLISVIVLVLLVHPPQIDERTSGVLMTIVGVLIACLKDVYSFFFGSSKGSEKKDDAMLRSAGLPAAPLPDTTAPVVTAPQAAPISPTPR